MTSILGRKYHGQGEILISEGLSHAGFPVRINLTDTAGRASIQHRVTILINQFHTGTVNLVAVFIRIVGTLRCALVTSSVDVVHLLTYIGIYIYAASDCCSHTGLQWSLRIPVILQRNQFVPVFRPVHVYVPRKVSGLYRCAGERQFNTLVRYFTCIDFISCSTCNLVGRNSKNLVGRGCMVGSEVES